MEKPWLDDRVTHNLHWDGYGEHHQHRGTTVTVPGIMEGWHTFALWWKPELWLRWFTDEEPILAVGRHYFRLVGPSYPCLGISMATGLALQGLGRATAPLGVMALRVAGVLTAALVCTQWLGLGERAVFTAISIGNLFAAGAMVALFLRARRHVGTAATAVSGSATLPPASFAGD